MLNSWLKKSASNKCYSNFADIIENFEQNNADRFIIDTLINYQIHYIKTSDSHVISCKPSDIAKEAEKRIELIIELLVSLEMINDKSTAKEVINYVITQSALYDVLQLIQILSKIQTPELVFLFTNHISRSLRNEIEGGLRGIDDWHIDATSQCNCVYCKILNEFMHSKVEINKEWPISKDIRGHIINMIKYMEVPITYIVEHKGSPYKLLLTKSDSIYKDSEKRFNALNLAYQDFIKKV